MAAPAFKRARTEDAPAPAMVGASVLSPLPTALARGLPRIGKAPADAVTGFISEALTGPAGSGLSNEGAAAEVERKLTNKAVALETVGAGATTKQKRRPHSKGPGLSSRRRKELGPGVVEADSCKFELWV